MKGEAENKLNLIIKLTIVGGKIYCHTNSDLLNERDEREYPYQTKMMRKMF